MKINYNSGVNLCYNFGIFSLIVDYFFIMNILGEIEIMMGRFLNNNYGGVFGDIKYEY